MSSEEDHKSEGIINVRLGSDPVRRPRQGSDSVGEDRRICVSEVLLSPAQNSDDEIVEHDPSEIVGEFISSTDRSSASGFSVYNSEEAAVSAPSLDLSGSKVEVDVVAVEDEEGVSRIVTHGDPALVIDYGAYNRSVVSDGLSDIASADDEVKNEIRNLGASLLRTLTPDQLTLPTIVKTEGQSSDAESMVVHSDVEQEHGEDSYRSNLEIRRTSLSEFLIEKTRSRSASSEEVRSHNGSVDSMIVQSDVESDLGTDSYKAFIVEEARKSDKSSKSSRSSSADEDENRDDSADSMIVQSDVGSDLGADSYKVSMIIDDKSDSSSSSSSSSPSSSGASSSASIRSSNHSIDIRPDAELVLDLGIRPSDQSPGSSNDSDHESRIDIRNSRSPDKSPSSSDSASDAGSENSMIEHEGVENQSENSYNTYTKSAVSLAPSEDPNHLKFYYDDSKSPVAVFIQSPTPSHVTLSSQIEADVELPEEDDPTEQVEEQDASESVKSGSRVSFELPVSDKTPSTSKSSSSLEFQEYSPIRVEVQLNRSNVSIQSDTIPKSNSEGSLTISDSQPVIEHGEYSPLQHEVPSSSSIGDGTTSLATDSQLAYFGVEVSTSPSHSIENLLSARAHEIAASLESIINSELYDDPVALREGIAAAKSSNSIVLETALKIMHSKSSDAVLSLCQSLERTLDSNGYSKSDVTRSSTSILDIRDDENLVIKTAKQLLEAKTEEELERLYLLLIDAAGVEDEEAAIESVLTLISSSDVPSTTTDELTDILTFCRNTLEGRKKELKEEEEKQGTQFSSAKDNLMKLLTAEYNQDSETEIKPVVSEGGTQFSSAKDNLMKLLTAEYDQDSDTERKTVYSEEVPYETVSGRFHEAKLILKSTLDEEYPELKLQAERLRQNRKIQVPIQNSEVWKALRKLLLGEYPPEEVDYILRTGRRFSPNQPSAEDEEDSKPPLSPKPTNWKALPRELIPSDVDLTSTESAAPIRVSIVRSAPEDEGEICDISEKMAARIRAITAKKKIQLAAARAAKKARAQEEDGEDCNDLPQDFELRIQASAAKVRKMIVYRQKFTGALKASVALRKEEEDKAKELQSSSPVNKLKIEKPSSATIVNGNNSDDDDSLFSVWSMADSEVQKGIEDHAKELQFDNSPKILSEEDLTSVEGINVEAEVIQTVDAYQHSSDESIIVSKEALSDADDVTDSQTSGSGYGQICHTSDVFTPCLTRTSLSNITRSEESQTAQKTVASNPDFGHRFIYGRNLENWDNSFPNMDADSPFIDRVSRGEREETVTRTSQHSVTTDLSFYNLVSLTNIPEYAPACSHRNCPCCAANKAIITSLRKRLRSLIEQFNRHMEFTLFTLLEMALFLLENPEEREHAIDTLERLGDQVWRTPSDLNIYQKVLTLLHLLDMENVDAESDMKLHAKCEKVLSDLISSHRASQMPDQVFGAHLILEEERRRFRATVENLEKQRAEAQEEVDDLINALRRERDLGDEEIIFLKAQLRGISATKYEAEDKAENLEKENEQLKEELKKETYKRKKLKERFLELQDLVNDESVVLVKEVEKKDEEIEALKEDIADLKDQVAAAEEERDKANDKEERLLEECEKLNQAVDELEDQLKASERDIVAYRTYLEEKGVNTDDVFDDAVVKAKTDLEEALRDKKDLEAQLDEIKQAVEDSEKELLEDIEAKEKKIQQLKRALDDNEYLHQTKYDDLFLDNEKLKEDVENLKEQLQEQLNNPTEELPELGVSQEKYDQLLSEMEKERQERLKLQNHYKDLKSYVDKDTSDLIAEVQERDAVIESMNDKLNDLDNLDQLEAELDWERKQRKIDEQKITELRLAISQDKKDIVADSERKSDMIRQLKSTLTDAKTNLERARYKQREIIANNQRLRADNQALQKEIDELKEKGVPGAPVDKKVEDLIDELKDCNRDLEKERELRGQLHQSFQDLKNTLSDEDADLADEIYKRDVIIANLHAQLREETDRLEQQLNNHRKREEDILDDYQTLKDKIENVERDCEPIGHQPAIKDLERDMFEDLTKWQEDEVRILDTALNDRTSQLSDLEDLLRNTEPGFDEERVHYVKELAAQEKENNELRALNRKMEKAQAERAKQYEKELDALNKELEALRRRQGNAITSEPINGSTESLPIAVMDNVGLEESGLGVSVEVDSFDLQRATPPGQAAPSPALVQTEPEKYDDSKERELVGQLRQIYSNLDLCRQDINRIVESFHDRIVRHHPRLQRTDSPTRLDARNIGATINSLLEGYHTQVTDLINRLNADSSAIARRNENLDEVVQQLESNLSQERARYDQLHARCKSYRQEIQDLRNRLKEGNIPQPIPMEGEHANHDLCQAVHELLNDIDSGPSTADGRVRAPSIQEISRLLLPVAEQSQVPSVYSTPDGAAFKEDCDVIQEKTDELTDLVKGLHSRLDAQKQAKIDALQDKVKEYEKEMDRLRDLIGEESEKENELENLRERNRQLALNLRDSQADLEGSERKNSILTDKFKEANDALSTATDELQELRRKTREREAYIRQLQENLRRADERIEEKDQSNEHLRNNCDELQEKAQQLSLLIKEVETKFVEKSRQYTILEKDLTKLKDDHKVITEFCDKKNIKIDELEHDLRDLIKENQKLVDENAELTDETQVKDEKIKELENRLDAKEKLIDELEKAAGKMADDITARDNVLQTMNNEVEKLEKELDEKDEMMKQLEEDLEQQDKDLEKIEQELQDAKEDLKDKEDEVNKLEDDKKNLEDDKKTLEDDKKNLEDEKDQLEDENKKLEDDLKKLEDENKKLEDLIDKLEDMIDNLKEDVDKLDKEVQDKDDVIKDLEDQLEDLKKQLEDAKAEDEKAKDLLDDLEKELDDKQKELDDTRDELDKANDELDELKPELERLNDEVKKLEDDVKDLEDTLKEEKDAADAIKEENDALKDDVDKLKDTVDDQKEDLDNLSKIVDDLEKDIEEAENDNKELTDENEELKKNIEDLAQQKQDILDEVQEAMKDMDGERADYKDNLKELKDFLEAQKNDMDELKNQIVEKPVMENRCMQTDVNETRSVKQQTDEQETMNVMIQTVIEEMKPPVRNRRVQTDVDALVVAAKSTAKTETRKSSSLHIIKALMTTIDRPTQTVDLQF